MRWIRGLSIRWKLTLVTVFTCAIAELCVGAVVALYTSRSYEERRSQDIAVQADELAASLAAPLVFNDASAAREYLDAFKADREVDAAGAYASNGALVASFSRFSPASSLLPSRSPPLGRQVAHDKLMISRPVKQAGNVVGSVYLIAQIDTPMTQFLRMGELMLLAVAGSLLIALPLSIRLNTAVSKAIRDIARAASRVTDGDLNAELPSTTSTDEVGTLVVTFGKMMSSLRDLMQQERLRALGQMSSGIAHDINNAMSPMALHTQSLLERSDDLSPKMRSYLETVTRVVEDVSATVDRMREFSRNREPEMVLSPLDMNELVGQVIELTRVRWSDMQQRVGSVIEMRIELAPDLPPFMGAKGEIRDALTNLIFNAVDAMPKGGALVLRTALRHEMEQHVDVEVADSGVGMDEDTKRRCLEPFFTTKGERGTGLGMAMVYGAVRRHSADISIESEVGKGTTVRLSFPACSAIDIQHRKNKTADEGSILPQLILVVDDDPIILDSMRLVLELDGHDVTVAEGGQNGIDACQAAQDAGRPYDYVITDLGMPYVDGRQVACAVKDCSPDAQVILLTGWGRRMNAEGEKPPHVDHLLGKPPNLDELRAVLAAAS